MVADRPHDSPRPQTDDELIGDVEALRALLAALKGDTSDPTSGLLVTELMTIRNELRANARRLAVPLPRLTTK